MTSLEQQILTGCVVVLFGAAIKLMDATRRQVNQLKTDVRVLTAEFKVLKEYWMRTAERRDVVLKDRDRWKDYALKAHGVSLPPESPVSELPPPEPNT